MKKVCLLFTCFLITAFSYAQPLTLNLTKNWHFKKAEETRWYQAEVPGTVHTDLLANKLIPDPFYRDNEAKVQWVETEDWDYKTVSDLPSGLHTQPKVFIQFDGLDTYADVWLNGMLILQADNMFRQWTAEVKSILKSKGNQILVRFYSTAKKAKQAKARETIPYPDNERIYARKAQYQFGWDWAPRLLTSGIWKEVKLTTDTTAKKLVSPDKNVVRLITQKDSIGESFYFTVNGKPTFIKGANWVPADSFLPRAKKLKRYEQLIKAAKEANINMLRVWGGGIYEDDVFYDLCDRYGIMVWQDFMFAGAMYPADSAFLKNIEAEVRYQVARLKHHRSIVLWCGNNEIEEAWFNWGWQKQFNYSAVDSARLWNDYKAIFHKLIPDILKELDPDRPYWPSSPSLGWGRDSAYMKGDVHYWGVWWGKEPVEKYNDKAGHFVSEYGMQGMPDMKTIEQFAPAHELDTTSASMRAHQKHPFGWENIKHYIEQKFRTPKTFEDLVYVSQLMQADAIKTAIEAHRRNQPKTMGTMFWQWNDCWPVTSWSAVDYYGRKKAMYYEVKRSFDSLTILPSWFGDTLQVKLSNHGNYSFANHELAVTITDFNFKYVKYQKFFPLSDSSTSFNLFSTANAEFLKAGIDTSKNIVYLDILTPDENGDDKFIASNIVFLAKPKNLLLIKPIIDYIIETNRVVLTADTFCYGVIIKVPDGVELADNYFHLKPNVKKIIPFKSSIPTGEIRKGITIRSLADTY